MFIKTKYSIKRFAENIENVSDIPAKIPGVIIKTIEDFTSRFSDMEDAAVSKKPQPDKWSKKEILGHLIDSASNNHQRFVRVQHLKSLNIPGYEQQEWVKIQQYNSREWKELLSFWRFYNLHLAHIIGNMNEESLQVSITIGTNEPTTIGHIVVDYLGHIQHHLQQIEQMK
ncbi:MAG: DinB family protein [Bacteroidetes bacterium]|nr:DinB family protein [Bacteroidota bacterium]